MYDIITCIKESFKNIRGDFREMFKKLSEINSGLRTVFLLMAGLFVWIKLSENKNSSADEGEDGYQTREFDDIW